MWTMLLWTFRPIEALYFGNMKQFCRIIASKSILIAVFERTYNAKMR